MLCCSPPQACQSWGCGGGALPRYTDIMACLSYHISCVLGFIYFRVIFPLFSWSCTSRESMKRHLTSLFNLWFSLSPHTSLEWDECLCLPLSNTYFPYFISTIHEAVISFGFEKEMFFCNYGDINRPRLKNDIVHKCLLFFWLSKG